MTSNSNSQNETNFDAKTTALQAANGIDLTGKVCIITGSNTGIGKETARVMALQGCTVYMANRNQTKAQKAKDEIAASIESQQKNFDKDAKLKLLTLDLSSLESVYNCAKSFLALNQRLDYLINNAGVMAIQEFTETSDGYEMQFGVNHLGHFYFTTLLTPSLVQPQHSARIVNVSSGAHGSGKKILAVIKDGIKSCTGPPRNGYAPWANYGLSKASNILFAFEHSRRFAAQGVVSVSLHPGVIMTELQRHLKDQTTFKSWVNKTIEQGAATTVRCVSLLDDEIRAGHYYVDCQENNKKLASHCKPVVVTDDDDGQIRTSAQFLLWQWSELLITKKGFPLAVESGTGNDKNVNVNVNVNSKDESKVNK